MRLAHLGDTNTGEAAATQTRALVRRESSPVTSQTPEGADASLSPPKFTAFTVKVYRPIGSETEMGL